MESVSNLLLIGPLPPPYGGARVSFFEFFAHLKKTSHINLKHFDLPVRSKRNCNPPGPVNHIKTIIGMVESILRGLRGSQIVLIFGSKKFLFSYGLLVTLISKVRGKKCFIRFFGGHPVEAVGNLPYGIKKILLALIGLNTGIIVETDVGRKEFPKALQKKINVIYGYRSPSLFNQRCIRSDSTGKIRFVYAGEISSQKGIGILLAAFQQLSSTEKDVSELHLYGAVKENDFLKVDQNNAVIYHGVVENESLCRDLSEYDVFVFPSLYLSEGHPGVVIEAFMAGLPVIATKLSGPMEIVKDGENGLIVEPGSINDLTQKMERLAKDQGLTRKLTQGAVSSASLFDISNIFPQFMNLMGLEKQSIGPL